ncbi:hypothetical protein M378DRAFT_156091 [Amanita muscaria Koide BX008]|uniref:Mediator of RNA polymerase II transcription subunit 20 n=1 Tax=Amanita muscaria (strain Koide BX008) TaxID=946122 RepID=A0A0C2X6V1_AMAMK|nr:hypothetical protein M378DRAFT_156091 [Amanita muscaria Koide BX008]
MGFTGLARWVNAPTTGLQLVTDNLRMNHNGEYRGKWMLSVRSYRSTLGQSPGSQITSERTMCALTMDDNVFVHVEDPAAPTKADVLAAAPPGQEAAYLQSPSHYRTTFLTLTPPNALEQLISQLKARWVPVRQSSGAQKAQVLGPQLTIEGHIFAIGTDWLVRAGNVILAGGAVRGMLLEAEYLPLPALHSPTADGTSELLSNLLTSVLPNLRDAKTVAVTISDMQWEEVLWDREEDGRKEEEKEEETEFIYGDDDATSEKKGDWTGIDRDRRSAYLIMGALRSEGIL